MVNEYGRSPEEIEATSPYASQEAKDKWARMQQEEQVRQRMAARQPQQQQQPREQQYYTDIYGYQHKVGWEPYNTPATQETIRQRAEEIGRQQAAGNISAEEANRQLAAVAVDYSVQQESLRAIATEGAQRELQDRAVSSRIEPTGLYEMEYKTPGALTAGADFAKRQFVPGIALMEPELLPQTERFQMGKGSAFTGGRPFEKEGGYTYLGAYDVTQHGQTETGWLYRSEQGAYFVALPGKRIIGIGEMGQAVPMSGGPAAWEGMTESGRIRLKRLTPDFSGTVPVSIKEVGSGHMIPIEATALSQERLTGGRVLATIPTKAGDLGFPAPFISVGRSPEPVIRTFQPSPEYIALSMLAMPGSPVGPVASFFKFKTSPGTITETTFGTPKEMPTEITKTLGVPTTQEIYNPKTGETTIITTLPETTITKGGTITPVTIKTFNAPSELENLDKRLAKWTASLFPSREKVEASGYAFFRTREELAPPSVKGIVGGVGAGYEWFKEHPASFGVSYGEAYAGGLVFRGFTEISTAGKIATEGTKLAPVTKAMHFGITKAAPWAFAGLITAQGVGETTDWGKDLSLERMGPRAGIFTARTILPVTGAVSGYRAPEDIVSSAESVRGLGYIGRRGISQLQMELGMEPPALEGMYRPDFTGVRATHAASGGFEFAEESGVNPETFGLTQKALAQKESWLFGGRPPIRMEQAEIPENIPLGERITLETEPMFPATQETIRLYCGETTTGTTKPIPEWIKETPEFKATAKSTGRWFTSSLEDAVFYSKEGTGRISYLDIPKSLAEQYKVSNMPQGTGSPRTFSAKGMESTEFFLPEEIVLTKKPLGFGERILSNLPVIGVVSQRMAPARTIGLKPSFIETPKGWGYGGYAEPEASIIGQRELPAPTFIGLSYARPTPPRSGVVQVVKPRYAISESSITKTTVRQIQEPELVSQKKRKSLEEQLFMPAQKSRFREDLLFKPKQEQKARQDITTLFAQETKQTQTTKQIQIPQYITQEQIRWDEVITPPPPVPPPFALPYGGASAPLYGYRGLESWVEYNPVAANFAIRGKKFKMKMPRMPSFKFPKF